MQRCVVQFIVQKGFMWERKLGDTTLTPKMWRYWVEKFNATELMMSLSPSPSMFLSPPLSSFLSLSFSLRLYVSLLHYPSLSPFTSLFAILPISLSINLCTCLSLCKCVSVSFFLSFLFLPLYLSISAPAHSTNSTNFYFLFSQSVSSLWVQYLNPHALPKYQWN